MSRRSRASWLRRLFPRARLGANGLTGGLLYLCGCQGSCFGVQDGLHPVDVSIVQDGLHPVKENLMEKFGNNLKIARKNANLTQIQVAHALNVSERHYRSFEAGAFEPDLAKLVALADLFGVSVDWLLGRRDSDDA